jgi:glyoxylase I family protein
MGIDVKGMTPLLSVFDMPTSIEFYRDVLGFEIVSTSGPGDDFGWALLRHGDVELMLNTAYDDGERPPAPDAGHIEAHHDTVLYCGCPDVDAAYHYLRSRGIDVQEPEIAYYGMKQLYVHDPDGYNLCFQWPTARETRGG